MKIPYLKCGLLLALCSLSFGFTKEDPTQKPSIDYRQEMRNFVIGLSRYAKAAHPGFIVIPQNGQELITRNGENDGGLQTDYVKAIDATGREDMFFGYNHDDVATPKKEKTYLVRLCAIFTRNHLPVLATDYCSTPEKMDAAYAQNAANGFISFAADNRNLNDIPRYPKMPFRENTDNITAIAQAKNYLYLINPEKFKTKQDFIQAVAATNYDALVMDLYLNDEPFTRDEIARLQVKKNGGKRLVICYMSIGEAEDYRPYWKAEWKLKKPDWLLTENPDWKGNFKVKYWQKNWQDIIYGNDASYLKKILNAGFEGVYLDIIDGFEYFE